MAPPGNEKVKQASVGKAMKEAVETVFKKELHETDEGLRRKLGSISPYIAKMYAEERRKLMQKGAADEELAELEDRYRELSASPSKIETYLREECIPALEKSLEETRGESKRKRLEEEIWLASMDAKQLRAITKLDAIADRLEFEFGYIYIPNALRREKRMLMEKLDECMLEHLQRGRKKMEEQKQRREGLVAQLEELANRFSRIASSPEETERYLRDEIGQIDERKRIGLEPDGEDKKSMVALDLKRLKENIERAKPALYRFWVGDFEAVSDPLGTRVVRLVHKDGTQVAYVNDSEIRVASAGGERAIYRNGEIVEICDMEGNAIQFSDGRLVAAIDSDGNALIIDPNDPQSYKLLKRDGSAVIDPRKVDRFLKRFERLLTSFGNAPILEKEVARLQYNFNAILERADKAKGEAEKQLKEISKEVAWAGAKEKDIGSCITKLSEKLRGMGLLAFDGKPTGEGFDAKLLIYGKTIDAKVISAETVRRLEKAAIENHPAGVFIDPEKTLIVEVPEMVFEREKKTEHPAQYSRVFMVKTDEGYLTILAIHSEMLAAIRNNDFTKLGEHIYRSAVKEFSDAGYKLVGLQLKLEQSEMYRDGVKRYGEEFMDAMRRKDYEALGRYAAFDRLVHNVTHSLTRPRVRAYIENESALLNVTDEDRKRNEEFILMIISEAIGKERFQEVRAQLTEMKNYIGDEEFLGSAEGIVRRVLSEEELQRITGAVLRAYLEAYGFGEETSTELGFWNSKVKALRDRFFAHPDKESYVEYQKADEFREILRRRDAIVSHFICRIADRDSEYFAMSENDAKAYRDRCKTSFLKVLELARISDQGKAVDEALAIAMQRGRYRARAVPTSFSMSIYLQNAAKELGLKGTEALFKEVCGETTPWDIVLRAKQLLAISRPYNYSPIANRIRAASREELMRWIELVLRGVEVARGPA